MRLFLFLYALYRLSTVYSGSVNKILSEDSNLYVSTPYRIYRNKIDFLDFTSVVQDLYVKGDTVIVLNRGLGTFNTYTDVYVNGKHIKHFNPVSGGKYVEKGRDFYLVATDFNISVGNEQGHFYSFNIYSGHVFCDTMIAGYIGLSNDFAVFKPVFIRDSVFMDTVFSQTGVPFQRDFFYDDSALYFIGYDGNLYELSCEDGLPSLKRLFTGRDGSFHFGSVVSVPGGGLRFYLSTFDRTYVYKDTVGNNLSLIDSLDFIALDFVLIADTLYARSTDGSVCRVRNRKLIPELGYPATLYGLRLDSDYIFLKNGYFPAVLDIKDPVNPSFMILDTLMVKDFLYNDTMFVYLTAADSLFLERNGVVCFIDDSVSSGMVISGKYLYYKKDSRVVAFNLEECTESAYLELVDENIFKFKVYQNNLYVVSLDSSDRYLRIRKMDTLLGVLNIYEIYGGGAYISPVNPDFAGNFMFIPYIRQGLNEYRISVLDIENNVFTSEFQGHGGIKGIKAISQDTVFILERPYGMIDVRLGIVDFGDSTFSESEYVGIGGGNSAILSDGRFLFVYTEGKLDIFLIPDIPVKYGIPYVFMRNIITQRRINIYSLYNTPENVLLEIYNVAGRKVFYRWMTMFPGDNHIYLDNLSHDGLFILRLKTTAPQKEYTFKFIYKR